MVKSKQAATTSAIPSAALEPGEWATSDTTVTLLALMMFLMPALGMPHEELLQDSLKSMVASFFALGAMLWFLWRNRQRTQPVRWHVLMWFPILVCVHALSAMAWAHNAYLPAAEAVRWFIFGVLLWLGLSSVSRDKFTTLAMGVHTGAAMAALWGMLQFWINLKLFPQGPPPASTFVNRNFGAEFIVTTLPLTIYLLLRAQTTRARCWFAATFALNLVYVFACGTRAALISLSLTAMPLAVGLFLYRSELKVRQWSSNERLVAVCVFVCTFFGLGLIPSGIPTEEFKGVNAFGRTFARAQTLQGVATEESFGMRKTMWAVTLRMIADRPLSGVGGGVWEVDQPLYQNEGAQLETDYYAHNEFLQHLAEYGLVGWITIVGTVAYLALSAWRTFRDRHREDGQAEGLLRMTALCMLFALFVVSNAGFPWRMATTCCLFALGLAMVAASDFRMGYAGPWLGGGALKWSPLVSKVLLLVFAGCAVLAAYVTQQAIECEHKIVRATKLAMGVAQSGDPHSPRWDDMKQEIVQLLREGVAINTHYRKVTPIAADELGRWGDLSNAIWAWESVLASRPYVVAIMANVAKANLALGQPDRAVYWLNRMQRIQPKSVLTRSVEVMLLERVGQTVRATQQMKQYMVEKTMDADMALLAYQMGMREHDWPMALDALEQRRKLVPRETPLALVRMAEVHDQMGDSAKALARYREALQLVGPAGRNQVLAIVPRGYQDKL
jgi:O-antigen ligase